MLVGNLTALFSLDTSNFTSGLKQVEESTKKTSDRIKDLGDDITRSALPAIGTFTLKITAMATAAYFATNRIAHLISDVEAIRRTMEFSTGSLEKSARAFSFLERQSERLGLSLEIMAKNFAQLSSAAKNTSLSYEEVEEIFLAIAEASAVMGLSTQRLELSFLAIQQMVSKGVISMEELRRQLGENLPGALGIMAKALGVTTEELNKMVANGSLLAEDVLPLFAKQLRLEMAGSLSDLSDSIQAALGKLSTAWFKVKEQMTDGVVESAISAAIAGYTKLVQGLEITLSAVNSLGRGFKELGSFLAKFRVPSTFFYFDIQKEAEETVEAIKKVEEEVKASLHKVTREVSSFNEKFGGLLESSRIKTKQLLSDPFEAARIKVKSSLAADLKALEDYVSSSRAALEKKVATHQWATRAIEALEAEHSNALRILSERAAAELAAINEKALQDRFKGVLSFVQTSLSEFNNFFADWALGMDVSFKEMLNNFGRRLLAFTTQLLVFQPILQWFRDTLYGGGMASSFLGGIITPSAPAFDGGGPPLGDLGGAPAKNVNVTINALDSKSLTDLMRTNPQAVTAPLVEALNNGDKGVMTAIRDSF